MHSPHFRLSVFLLLLLMLLGCEDPLQIGKQKPCAEPGTGEFYLEKAKEVQDSREKIALLNKGIQTVRDKNDSILPDLLTYKIYYHNRQKEYDSSLKFADRLLEVAQLQEDTSHLAEGYYRKSKVHFYLQNNEEVFKNAFEASKYYLVLGDSSHAGRRMLEMANAQARSGDVTGSQETATEALRYLNENSDSSYISASYNLLGMAYERQKFYRQAISEYENALNFATRPEDRLPNLNNLAVVQMELKKYDSAISIWEDLIAEVDSTDLKALAHYKDNLAYVQWLREPEHDLEQELLEAMYIRQEINDRNGLLTSYAHLAEYYSQKDVSKARAFSEKSVEAAREYGSPTAELNALERLIRLSPAANFRNYSVRHIVLNDSLNTANLRAKNTFAKIRFDEERKQQEIAGLEAENARQALETQRLKTRNLAAMMIGLFLVLAIFFLLYYLRQRHRKEKIEEVHKTENRISKMIHDELANDLYNVMSSLEPVAPTSIVDKLEKIYLRTRNISRENREINTGEGYLENLIGILSNTTPADAKLFVRGEDSVNWEKLSEEKKIVLYRVLQELMVNMNKHSSARLVAINFTVSGKRINISYSDNGVGMDMDRAKKGNGLNNVRNRISSINGKITFDPEEGRGFKANIAIPS